MANGSYWHDVFGAAGTEEPFLRAMAEAWDWLILNGLVAPQPHEGSLSGWAFVTRRGKHVVQDSNPRSLLRAEERIAVDLHPMIADDVRTQFLLGKYEFAALAALKAVEIRVRELAVRGDEAFGVPLMRSAFHPETGPLADEAQVAAERQATADLFAGAIGVFKNPSSHREVEYGDATFAAEVVLLGDLLLRMLDRVEARARD